jgi:hypothetical protein
MPLGLLPPSLVADARPAGPGMLDLSDFPNCHTASTRTMIRRMAEDILHRVNRLIRQCKEQAGPAPTSPEDVRRYVALSLGVAEPVAEELILKAGSRGANPYG